MAKGNKVSAASMSPDNSWQAESDLRTLMDAEEIKEDAKRMDAVRALAKEKLVDMAKISVTANVTPEKGDKKD